MDFLNNDNKVLLCTDVKREDESFNEIYFIKEEVDPTDFLSQNEDAEGCFDIEMKSEGMIKAKKNLTLDELAAFIEDDAFGNDSEIDGLSDDDIVTGIIETPQNEEIGIDDNQEDDTNEGEIELDSSTEQKKCHATNERVTWVKRDFIPLAPMEEIEDTVASEPLSAYSYFSKFITKDFIENLSQKTNMYHLQNTGKNLNVSPEDIKVLIGIHIEMGSVPFPNMRLYWSKDRRYNLIADAMTFNRFSTLRNNLHCVDNLQHNPSVSDKFWKVKPIMDEFMKVISKETVEKRVCIDEQMIPFKGKLEIKQYMKGKPNPWGIKIFFLCGESGMPYSFIPFQGKSTMLPVKYSDLGLSGSVVMTLAESRLKPHSNYRLFFDNFFTSPKLVANLLAHDIYCTGTVRANKIGNPPPIKNNKELQKEGRGAMDGCTSSDGSMCLVKWNDNAIVTLLSSAYDWDEENYYVPRWDKSQREKINIPCPSPVIQYNKGIGGVDKLDFLLGLYRIDIKSKKWTLRVIFHFVDLAVVTSWLQYRRDSYSSGVPGAGQMTLLQFRLKLAEAMIKVGSNPLLNVSLGRPKNKNKFQFHSGNDVRFDGVGHFPDWKKERQRCKNEKCKNANSYVTCIKCNVTLCLNKDRNCFLDYHS